DALVGIADERYLHACVDELFKNGLMERANVLCFVNQDMRIPACQGAKNHRLFPECAITPVTTKIVCISTRLPQSMDDLRGVTVVQFNNLVIVRVVEVDT